MLKIRSVLARVLNGYGIGYNFADLLYYINFLFFENKQSVTLKECVPDFDVVVLSLTNSAERRNYMHIQLNGLNIKFIILDSIEGETQQEYIYNKLQLSRFTKKHLPLGSLGGILSHMAAWKKLIDSNYKMCLVLEDDVTLKLNYEEIKTKLNMLPEHFDILYCGSGSHKGWFFMRKIEGFIFKPFSIRKGAYAYIITYEGAKKLLELIQDIHITCGGIDTLLGILTMRKKINAFHLYPEIASHLNLFKSSITKK